MTAALINHLWQSTLFTVMAGLLTIGLRQNSARIRYWLWFSASFKFLVPCSLLIGVGSKLAWRQDAQQLSTEIAGHPLSSAMAQITQPFQAMPSAQYPEATRDWAPLAILCVWACGFAAIAIVRLRHWFSIRSTVRSSSAIELPVPMQVRSSPGLLEPGVVGFFRPLLLLPSGIVDCLTPRQLDAVLAHELCHIRRRDNLFSSIHMIVEAMFWFHPLVWWIGARLMDERERACDEEVLRSGSEPRVYAEGILNVCKLYVESPLKCVSGVTGSNLKKRIEDIMNNRRVFELSFAKRMVLAVAGVTALAMPVIVGLTSAPTINAQPGRAKIESPPAVQKFDVAAVKPCPPDGRLMNDLRGGTPGRLTLNCFSLRALILNSYVLYANGRWNQPTLPIVPIKNSPPWVDSDRYTVEAKAEGNPSQGTMRGPMMQALLEDRFRLKLHSEYQEIPVYFLTVASGGLKLQRAREGSCQPMLLEQPAAVPAQGKPSLPICGMSQTVDSEFRMYGVTMADIAASLFSDRGVIDKTGIAGAFDVRVPLPRELIEMLTPRPPPPPPGASASADPTNSPGPGDIVYAKRALAQKLGLKLEPGKGPGQVLVIDHVERPSEN